MFDAAKVNEQGHDILFVVVPDLLRLSRGQSDAIVAWARSQARFQPAFAGSSAAFASPSAEVVVLCTYTPGQWHFYGPDSILPLCQDLPAKFVQEHINGRLEWAEQQRGDEGTSEHGEYRLN